MEETQVSYMLEVHKLSRATHFVNRCWSLFETLELPLASLLILVVIYYLLRLGPICPWDWFLTPDQVEWKTLRVNNGKSLSASWCIVESFYLASAGNMRGSII
jgi:hypothetical protein